MSIPFTVIRTFLNSPRYHQRTMPLVFVVAIISLVGILLRIGKFGKLYMGRDNFYAVTTIRCLTDVLIILLRWLVSHGLPLILIWRLLLLGYKVDASSLNLFDPLLEGCFILQDLLRS